ncbi:MAG: RNA polymerase sigma factor [Dysgonamonadaceae bacterium]|jgi:RNA polymerase sigma-70 factor (ECF subfamily)|nr:RNA polymerase sigma factor [Dysgonamonadaceae bacterium]
MNKSQFQEKILGIQGNMYNFAMMLTANKDDAQDLLQDTTLKALDNQEKYVDNINFKGWVLTIMRNIFINNYRKVVRSQTIIDKTEDLYHLNLSQDSGFDTPEGAFTIKEIDQAIHHLNSDLKMPFSLFLAGYKYNEISEKLNLPLGTVKSRIFFARQELQRALKGMR